MDITPEFHEGVSKRLSKEKRKKSSIQKISGDSGDGLVKNLQNPDPIELGLDASGSPQLSFSQQVENRRASKEVPKTAKRKVKGKKRKSSGERKARDLVNFFVGDDHVQPYYPAEQCHGDDTYDRACSNCSPSITSSSSSESRFSFPGEDGILENRMQRISETAGEGGEDDQLELEPSEPKCLMNWNVDWEDWSDDDGGTEAEVGGEDSGRAGKAQLDRVSISSKSTEDQLKFGEEVMMDLWNDVRRISTERFFHRKAPNLITDELRNTWLRIIEMETLDEFKPNPERFSACIFVGDDPPAPIPFDSWSRGTLEVLPLEQIISGLKSTTSMSTMDGKLRHQATRPQSPKPTQSLADTNEILGEDDFWGDESSLHTIFRGRSKEMISETRLCPEDGFNLPPRGLGPKSSFPDLNAPPRKLSAKHRFPTNEDEILISEDDSYYNEGHFQGQHLIHESKATINLSEIRIQSNSADEKNRRFPLHHVRSQMDFEQIQSMIRRRLANTKIQRQPRNS